MSKLKNNEYIVFQPDQVLTSDHLNQLFYYLDRQNRLTRNKLIGMGIVCGLELEITENTQSAITTIQIDKGCGLSSEGYLIIESTDKTYTHAILYTPPTQPADLPFTCPSVPFYNSTTSVYTSAAPIYKLMTCEQYTTFTNNPSTSTSQTDPCAAFNNASSTVSSSAAAMAGNMGSPPSSPPNQPAPPQPFPLSSPPAGIAWSGYAVVLFLEASEKDLKNCDMQDCDNKGEKMVFHIRPLLVPKQYLTNSCQDDLNSQKAPEIRLKRFNVTYNDLSDSQSILTAFYNIFSNDILTSLPNAYNYCYNTYQSVLPDDANPFLASTSPPGSISFANHLKKMLELIWLQSDRITIQYFYDYINDLILAYYEFREAAEGCNFQCCANECAFPLHLTLGDATVSTNELIRDCWRQYFIYSPLFDTCNNSLARLRFYFKRMEILAAQSPFPLSIATTDRYVRITPSQYEVFPLSQRAIPYYYNETPITADSLFQYWNFERTLAGDAAFNLSYNASQYNVYDLVVNNPLEYDIEQYRFFRIEGHIGLPYTEALTAVIDQRRTYNLPFDVVAVSAELLKDGSTKIPTCNILDLETDFRLLLNEFLCKLFLCIYRLLKLKYNQDTFSPSTAAFNAGDYTTITDPQASAFISNFKPEYNTYQIGDFIANFSPGNETIGQGYTNSILNGVFTNPVNLTSINEQSDASLVRIYYIIFELLNAADNLFFLLLNTALSAQTGETLSNQFKIYDTRFNDLQDLLLAQSRKNSEFATLVLQEFFDNCGCDCLICLLEAMLVILLEYRKRVLYYQSQLSFLHYFRKHPGLEHKAGVPKGGTFVLVYHQEPTTTDSSASPYVTAIGQIKEMLKTSTGFAQEFLNQVDTLAGQYLPRAQANLIPDGVVIADFYVPYLCCSDCAPVAYVLPTIPPPLSPPQPPAVFTIQPSTFLYDDAHNYPFVTTPPVNTLGKVQKDFSSPELANPGNLKLMMDANNILYLHPAMDDPATGTTLSATLTTSLTYQGIKLAITIIKPDATFTIAITQSGSFAAQIQVSAKNVDTLATYSWAVNGINNLFQPVANPPAIDINKLFPTGGIPNAFPLSLTISYNLNGAISTDTKTTMLTQAIIKDDTNQPPFTPVFQ